MSVLISAQEVAHLATIEQDLLLLDCRHDLDLPEAGRQAYAAAHIPGSIFLSLDEDLSGPLNGSNGRHPLPDASQFISLLESKGIRSSTKLIIYDANNGAMAAARAWWMLSQWLGLPHVQVLDGGLAAWQQAGLPLTEIVPVRTPSHLDLTAHSCTVDSKAVLANIGTQAFLLVDARSADRFAGQNETRSPVAGHIPGAANRWFGENLQADGRFKSAATLRQEWQTLLGANRPEQMVAQCGSGVTACHNLLALQIAGLPGARLYPGSWSEWISDPQRPVVGP